MLDEAYKPFVDVDGLTYYYTREINGPFLQKKKEKRLVKRKIGCTCQNNTIIGHNCRCTCDKCGSKNLRWEAWGCYLDKDLVCQSCKHIQSIWDC